MKLFLAGLILALPGPLLAYSANPTLWHDSFVEYIDDPAEPEKIRSLATLAHWERWSECAHNSDVTCARINPSIEVRVKNYKLHKITENELARELKEKSTSFAEHFAVMEEFCPQKDQRNKHGCVAYRENKKAGREMVAKYKVYEIAYIERLRPLGAFTDLAYRINDDWVRIHPQ